MLGPGSAELLTRCLALGIGRGLIGCASNLRFVDSRLHWPIRMNDNSLTRQRCHAVVNFVVNIFVLDARTARITVTLASRRDCDHNFMFSENNSLTYASS